MATSSKKGQTRGNTKGNTKKKTGSKANSGSKKNNNAALNSKVKLEAVLLVILALCIIFFLSNFGFGGVVGKGISSFFFGLFGLFAYIFPIVLFIAVIFGVSNKNSSVARVKIISCTIEIIILCILIQLISGNHADEWKPTDYYYYASVNKNGGGFFGGILCKLFCTWFGLVGAYIFTIILLIIGGVVITERSFIGGIKKGSKKIYDTARNDVKEYREDAKEKRREREAAETKKQEEKNIRRTERSRRGVTKNTTLGEENIDTTIYNFENAADREPVDIKKKNTKKELKNESKKELEKEFQKEVPYEEKTYQSASKEADYAMRHFQDEQSLPFEPAYEEEYVEIPKKAQKPQTDNIKGTEEKKLQDSIDMELVKKELEKENLLADSKKEKENQENKKDKDTEGAANTEHPEHTEKQEQTEKPEELEINENQPVNNYRLPPLSLLKRSNPNGARDNGESELNETAKKLQQTLATFGVKVSVTDVSRGPSVTRYEIQPEQGVKVSKIVSLADDIKLNLAAADIRIEAPIPGKAAVGIEVPNRETTGVLLGDLIASRTFRDFDSKICFASGKDIAGQTVIADIAKMPHLLIAGSTGSGKSVCINTIVMSILYHAKPDEVKLIMVDPKVVELNVYNGIPHLLTPVVTDPKKAASALNWAVAEMMKRYNLFAQYEVRNMQGFNEKIEGMAGEDNLPEKMPQIVIIVDEFADLMMVASKEVEDAVVRLAQLARAAGIHLILATQRPTANVITGLIKANVPSRIAFSVGSQMDSRVILDMGGAEKLLGKGDMLYYPAGYNKPARVQGAFVSDEEVVNVVQFIKDNNAAAVYSEDVKTHISNPAFEESQAYGGDLDQFFVEAGRFIIEKERASIGALQRVFKIGFNRAARIMDQLGDAGVVGPEEGTKPRKVMMTMEEFENFISNM